MGKKRRLGIRGFRDKTCAFFCPAPSPRGVSVQWNLDNDGRRGLVGADLHALAAWTITRGKREVRVAVLDEGVDTTHPHLRAAPGPERQLDQPDHRRAPARADFVEGVPVGPGERIGLPRRGFGKAPLVLGKLRLVARA